MRPGPNLQLWIANLSPFCSLFVFGNGHNSLALLAAGMPKICAALG